MNKKQTQRMIRDAGGSSAVARALGIKPQALSQWDRVPVERVQAMEAITGVSRYVQRPDIFGIDPALRKSPRRESRKASETAG